MKDIYDALQDAYLQAALTEGNTWKVTLYDGMTSNIPELQGMHDAQSLDLTLPSARISLIRGRKMCAEPESDKVTALRLRDQYFLAVRAEGTTQITPLEKENLARKLFRFGMEQAGMEA